MKKEEWKIVPSLPPSIEVSSLGNVRKYVTATETQVVPLKDNDGYKQVNICGHTFGVHTLVALAFIEKPNSSCTIVLHKDKDRSNNEVSNLEWATRNGSFLGRSKTNNTFIYCKELDKTFKSIRSASYITGVHPDLINESISNDVSICGFTFSKVDNPEGTHLIDIGKDEFINLSKKAKSVSELVELASTKTIETVIE